MPNSLFQLLAMNLAKNQVKSAVSRIHPTSAFAVARTMSANSNSFDERMYNRLADRYMENLVNVLEDIGDDIETQGFDVVYSVKSNIKLRNHSTAINQFENRAVF